VQLASGSAVRGITFVHPPAVSGDVGPDAFRAAMRQLGRGVSVITVGVGRERSGMTATSVSALALDPPTLIVCLNKQCSTWPLLHRHRALGVNILHAGQPAIAERFAGRHGETGEQRYAEVTWITLATGTSLLADALATLDCELDETIDRHSHAVVIGRIKAIRTEAADGALVYWRGRYGAFALGDIPAA
jgi:flavin reductase (DIM6/NTAB) family NADH-FMN oxidoreductase RutF